MTIDDKTIQAVWEKGQIVSGRDSKVWRKDQCGALIKRDEYGNRGSKHGWEIDHITPSSKGGSDAPSNLRPLQWENNATRQDGRLTCPVKD
ncbi:MAG: HNH endonuclease [Fermentimonas sp.]|jgi:5-methylcytosine-specific restriction endonuclease McrA